jgi:hypothetical protein
LVEEFNQRLSGRLEIRFQNSLHRTSAADFQKLAAIVLRVLGCQEVFFTPSSHDQGVDAFGYQSLVQPTPYGATHAQAKHYAEIIEVRSGPAYRLGDLDEY